MLPWFVAIGSVISVRYRCDWMNAFVLSADDALSQLLKHTIELCYPVLVCSLKDCLQTADF